jgi:predicted alpha/beta superfamily hydrolase
MIVRIRTAAAVLLMQLLAVAALLAGGCAPAQAPPAAAPAASGVVLRLTEVPATTPAGATIYVAGTFNNWNPGDPGFTLTRDRWGAYAVMLPPHVRGLIEFKFTLGSWESAEIDAAGNAVPNRRFTVPSTGSATYMGAVAGWLDPSNPPPPVASTASGSVSVLSEEFAMPELGRTRRVWIYLPPDYATSGKRYPVLYMHDGQNVFDAATSYAGEWGVDETMDSLHVRGDGGAIVVGIDNGQRLRFDEYSPWRHPEAGGGEGDRYVDFLANTLKPYIDRNFRTRPEREHTAVAGSSMGGVISLYAALKHPDVFGHAGVFSPALWVTPQLYDYARAFDPSRPRPRLYFVSGMLEGRFAGQYIEDQNRMIEALVGAGFRVGTEVEALVRADGTHTEGFWRREFPAAYRWMLAGSGGAEGQGR